MSNNILLVYPKPKYNKNPRFGFSIQLLQLSSIFKNNGYNVFYIDYSYNDYKEEDFIKYLECNNISDVIVEIDTFALKRSENISNAIQVLSISHYRNIRTIAFGYDCILDGEDVLNADYIIKKNPLFEIPKIFGIITSFNSENSYDDLPFPDREILLSNEFFKKNSSSSLIRTGEGCLNTCTFCQRQGWQDRYKTHSLEYVLSEFEYLKNNNYKNIWIADENFTFNLNRAKLILKSLGEKELTENMKISLSSWCHIDFELLELAKKANVSIISMGIESANENILDFYNKKVDLHKTKELIDYADSIGIYMVGNFIIGAPMETDETINNTFEYIRNSKLNQVNIKILDYMIGSKLYEELDRKDEHHYFGCSENGLCNFSLQELKKKKDDFLKRFYDEKKKSLEEKIRKFGMPYNPIVF